MADVLTKDELALLERRREEWFQIGSSTEPANRPLAESTLCKLYGFINEPPPSTFIWVEAPLQAVALLAALKEGNYVFDEHGDEVERLLRAMGVEASTQPPKEAAQAENEKLIPILRKITKGFDSRKLPESLVGDILRDRSLYGSTEATWVAFYVFCREIGLQHTQENIERMEVWRDHCLSSGWIWCYRGFAILCDRASIIKWSSGPIEQRRLHAEGGPALQFRDGSSLFMLNGVLVPEWMAVPPAEQLDPRKVTSITNVEQRREFIRRVGMERIINALGAKVIDKEAFTNDTGTHEYELLEISNVGQAPWRYLKMVNPSVPGVFHLEGVPNACQTVREALNARNSLTEAQIDDENGADWFQQGDVILRPRGAKKYKRFPKVLT